VVFDIASNSKVAEHLPDSFAERFVSLSCELSHTVVMIAATPEQASTSVSSPASIVSENADLWQ